MFLKVIEALQELDRGKEAKERGREKHSAEGYLIGGGNCGGWGGGKRIRV